MSEALILRNPTSARLDSIPAARAPPMLKAMPSANSQVAIEQLLGLSGGPSPTKPSESHQRFERQELLQQSRADALAGQPAHGQIPQSDAIYPASAGAAPPMVKAVLVQPEGSNYYPSRLQRVPPPPISTPYGYPPGYTQQTSPLPSPTESGLVSPMGASLVQAQPMEPADWSGPAGYSPTSGYGSQAVMVQTGGAMGTPATALAKKTGKHGEAGEQGSTSRKGREVVPWRPSEDSTILQGVSRHGCKWSLIAQQLPGRSENAVRNRWHRLENAEQTRRKAIEAGLPVEGYRCRKCGHFKKGHMCLGLEAVAPDGTVVATTGVGQKRGHHQMAQPPQPMMEPMHTQHSAYAPVQHTMTQMAHPHGPMAPMHMPRNSSSHPSMAQPQVAQPLYYYAEELSPQRSQPYPPQQYHTQQPSPQQMPPQSRPSPHPQYATHPQHMQQSRPQHIQMQPHLQAIARGPPQGRHPPPLVSPTHSSHAPMQPHPLYYHQYGSQPGREVPPQHMMVGPHAPTPAPPRYTRSAPSRITAGDGEHPVGYYGSIPSSPQTAPISPGLEGFSEDVMEAFLHGTLAYREET